MLIIKNHRIFVLFYTYFAQFKYLSVFIETSINLPLEFRLNITTDCSFSITVVLKLE